MRTREIIEGELALVQNRCVELNNELRALNAKELGKYNVSFKIETDDDFELDFGNFFILHGNDVPELFELLKEKLNSAQLLWGCDGKWTHAKDHVLEQLQNSMGDWHKSKRKDSYLPYYNMCGNQEVDVYFNRT